MDHRVFRLATRGQCIKEKKPDCFEHIFCFELQCASIVVLLCTAICWKSKDAVVHYWTENCELKVIESGVTCSLFVILIIIFHSIYLFIYRTIILYIYHYLHLEIYHAII